MNKTEPAVRHNLESKLVDLIEQISIQVRPAMLEAWSDIELTMHQFRTLALLCQGPQRISDIAALLGIRLSSATSFIDRMEAKKLVERVHDPIDRRVVRIKLTPLGVKEANSLWKIDRRWLEHVMSGLDPREIESVARALSSLLDAMRGQRGNLITAAAPLQEDGRPAAKGSVRKAA